MFFNALGTKEEDESRGDSILLKWEMINESDKGFIRYIVFYEKN